MDTQSLVCLCLNNNNPSGEERRRGCMCVGKRELDLWISVSSLAADSQLLQTVLASDFNILLSLPLSLLFWLLPSLSPYHFTIPPSFFSSNRLTATLSLSSTPLSPSLSLTPPCTTTSHFLLWLSEYPAASQSSRGVCTVNVLVQVCVCECKTINKSSEMFADTQ